MEKVRFVNAIDYGKVRNDNKYSYTFAGGPSYAGSPPYETLRALAEGRHYSAMRSASKVLSLTYLQQVEKFYSSEFRRPQFNDCRHTILRTFNYPFTICQLEAAYGGRAEANCFARFKDNYSSYTIATQDWSGVSQNLQAEAFHTMLPRFEGDISVINTLFELKDFRDVSDALVNNVKGIHRLLNLNTAASTATKLLASARLTDSLAISPTVSEFTQLARECTTIVSDVQEKFRAKGEQPDIRHFSKTLNQSQNLVERGHSQLLSFDYIKTLAGSKSFTSFTATMEGDYGYTMRTQLEAWGKYWGLGITAEALWNMLPLSFVADYVFNIGHALDVMRHDQNVKYHVRQYSESLATTITSGIFLTRGNRNCYYRGLVVDDKHFYVNNDYDFSVPIAGTYSSIYERVVKSPYFGPYFPELKIPSKNQMLNMAALARCFL